MQVHRELGRIRQAGGELVLIGMGELRSAQAFQEEFRLACPIFVDSTRAAYRALEMKRSVSRTLALPSVWARRLRASRAGFSQKGVQGDPWQLGGVLVVRPGGQIVFRYQSDSSADHPPVAEILLALGDGSGH